VKTVLDHSDVQCELASAEMLRHGEQIEGSYILWCDLGSISKTEAYAQRCGARQRLWFVDVGRTLEIAVRSCTNRLLHMIRITNSPSTEGCDRWSHASQLPEVGHPDRDQMWAELARAVSSLIEHREGPFPTDLPSPEIVVALLHAARVGAERGRTVEDLAMVLLPLQRFAALQTGDQALAAASGLVDDALSMVITELSERAGETRRWSRVLSLADRIESNCHTLFHAVRSDLHCQRRMGDALRELAELPGSSFEHQLQRLVPLARRLAADGVSEGRALAAIGDLWECLRLAPTGAENLIDRRPFMARVAAWWRHAVVSAALSDLYPPERLAGVPGQINARARGVPIPPELPAVAHARAVPLSPWQKWCRTLADERIPVRELFQAVHAWMEREVVVYHGRWRGEVRCIAEGVLLGLATTACGMPEIGKSCFERAEGLLPLKERYAVTAAYRALDLVSLYAAEFHRSGSQAMLDKIRPAARRSLLVLGGADGSAGAERFLEEYLWRPEWYEGDLADERWQATLQAVGDDFKNFCGNTASSREERDQRYLTLIADKFLEALSNGTLPQLGQAVAVQTGKKFS